MIDPLEYLIVQVMEPFKPKKFNQKFVRKKKKFTILSPIALIICLVDKLGIARATMSNVLGSFVVKRIGLLFCTIFPVVSVNDR
jgi:hypothetical protein